MARDRDTPVPSRFPGALIRRAARRSRNRLAAHWNDRAAAWMARAEGRAARRRLRRAERLLWRAIGVTASERARRYFHLNLSLLLQQRHELSLSDGPSDAVEAVMAARRALAGLSAEEDWWCDALCNLADALLLVHATDPDVGTGTEAEEAVQCLVRAVADVPGGSDELPILIVRLGNALETWVDAGAADADTFDRSIGVVRDAVAEATDEERPTARLALAQVLCSVALATGWTVTFDEGIGIYRDLARELPPDSGVLHALGTALLLREETEHAPEAVAEALTALRAAVSAADPESAERRAVEEDLGAALNISYEHTGDPAFLDEAITLLRATVGTSPDGEPGLSLRRMRLGIVLDVRATRTGEAGDAREAAGDAAPNTGRPRHRGGRRGTRQRPAGPGEHPADAGRTHRRTGLASEGRRPSADRRADGHRHPPAGQDPLRSVHRPAIVLRPGWSAGRPGRCGGGRTHGGAAGRRQ